MKKAPSFVLAFCLPFATAFLDTKATRLVHTSQVLSALDSTKSSSSTTKTPAENQYLRDLTPYNNWWSTTNSPPRRSASTRIQDSLTNGRFALQQAISADASGDLDRALDLYRDALAKLTLSLKYSNDESVLNEIEVYLERAEEINEQLSLRNEETDRLEDVVPEELMGAQDGSLSVQNTADLTLDTVPAVEDDGSSNSQTTMASRNVFDRKTAPSLVVETPLKEVTSDVNFDKVSNNKAEVLSTVVVEPYTTPDVVARAQRVEMNTSPIAAIDETPMVAIDETKVPLSFVETPIVTVETPIVAVEIEPVLADEKLDRQPVLATTAEPTPPTVQTQQVPVAVEQLTSMKQTKSKPKKVVAAGTGFGQVSKTKKKSIKAPILAKTTEVAPAKVQTDFISEVPPPHLKPALVRPTTKTFVDPSVAAKQESFQRQLLAARLALEAYAKPLNKDQTTERVGVDTVSLLLDTYVTTATDNAETSTSSVASLKGPVKNVSVAVYDELFSVKSQNGAEPVDAAPIVEESVDLFSNDNAANENANAATKEAMHRNSLAVRVALDESAKLESTASVDNQLAPTVKGVANIKDASLEEPSTTASLDGGKIESAVSESQNELEPVVSTRAGPVAKVSVAHFDQLFPAELTSSQATAQANLARDAPVTGAFRTDLDQQQTSEITLGSIQSNDSRTLSPDFVLKAQPAKLASEQQPASATFFAKKSYAPGGGAKPKAAASMGYLGELSSADAQATTFPVRMGTAESQASVSFRSAPTNMTSFDAVADKASTAVAERGDGDDEEGSTARKGTDYSQLLRDIPPSTPTRFNDSVASAVFKRPNSGVTVDPRPAPQVEPVPFFMRELPSDEKTRATDSAYLPVIDSTEIELVQEMEANDIGLQGFDSLKNTVLDSIPTQEQFTTFWDDIKSAGDKFKASIIEKIDTQAVKTNMSRLKDLFRNEGRRKEKFVYPMEESTGPELDTVGMTERIMNKIPSENQASGAGGTSTWDGFKLAEENWSKLKSFKPFRFDSSTMRSSASNQSAPQFVTEDGAVGNPLCWEKLRAQDGKRCDFDIAVCGGTLGIFFATAMLLKGHKVAVIEAGVLRGREQEWNISMDELLKLKKLGVLTQDDIDAAITTEFPMCRSGFKTQETTPLKGGYFENNIGFECVTKDVLNLGVSPGILIERVSKRFKELGGVIKENTRLAGVAVSEKVGSALDLGPDLEPITASIVLDCMGNASPISRQQRWGMKPDGICAVVGSCAAGFDNSTNLIGDIIYTNSEIQDKGDNGMHQYFWETFPVGIGRGGKEPGSSDVKTTYMFTYMDADEKRPSLESLMEDYWKLLPKYQKSITNPETDLDIKRVLFAYFPTYRESPLKPQWSRVLAIGDASGIQSPLSFGGFGALTRHLDRISTAVSDALASDCLHKDDLAEINAYTPNLSAAWMFQKAMSVRMGQKVNPKFINRLLATNFEVMDQMGERTIKPFLQDVVRFDGLVGSLVRSFQADPEFMPEIVAHVGIPTLVEWLGHVSMIGAYGMLDTVVSPVMKLVIERMDDDRERFAWKRRMEAWKYGSGNDYTLPDEEP
jgi:hypothetical protein